LKTIQRAVDLARAWEFLSPITIQNSVAWGNGVNRWNLPNFSGDGNGFKLGGGDTPMAANHIVRNSIAFNNTAGGFIDNRGESLISSAGAVLLVQAARVAGLDRLLCKRLAPWRLPLAIHDPGKVVLDLAVPSAARLCRSW
jgi:hypothetical protein